MAKIIPLFSGSKGNSYFIGCGSKGILIDAGRSAKQLCEALSHYNINPDCLEAILITHEHIDHIKGLRVFASNCHVPVYMSYGTSEQLALDGHLKGVYTEYLRKDNDVYSSFNTESFNIQPFKTSHDTPESTCYRITDKSGRITALATDLGYISDTVKENLLGSDAVILESNHDVGMLRNGPYPYLLKRRILSDTGHLSNDDCSEILPQLVKGGTTRFLLAHLSRENNYPDLAYHCAAAKLQEHGMICDKDYMLSIAPEDYNGTIIYM
ncbi:MAG: MBL fold metallo-hydrolase [Clostridiales bacterium]|nr:MBL fold metallo-hydrolase [Clostridiales bacterium]